jgi:DNA modification methylase
LIISTEKIRILNGDVLTHLRELPDCSIHCCVTSPPYWGLRDYGVEGQIGLEKTPEEYVAKMVEVFREVKRVLRDDGTLWLNLGDSYATTGGAVKDEFKKLLGCSDAMLKASKYDHSRSMDRFSGLGLKPKDLVGIPWRVAFALQADGWYLRSDIIWSKPNPMPESVTDRPTKAHEYIFLLTKKPKYYYDFKAILEPANYDGRKDTKYKGGKKDVSCFAHERWPNKIPENNYGLNGAGFKGRSGNYGPDGELLCHSIDGAPARNKRTVWTVTTKPFKEAHFATFPEELIEPCILAGCPEGGVVLDPFGGAGTTGLVARNLQRDAILIELNSEYVVIIHKRLRLNEQLGVA